MRSADRMDRTAAGVAALATIAFVLPWWNRFLGVTLDGYFEHFGHRIAAGEIPYRDFFLHLPPLPALVDAALERLFGPSVTAAHALGAAGRTALAALVALWLARSFSPGVAAGATIAAVWLASGDSTDILDLYNHHALLAAIASGYCACRALDRGRRSDAWWIASGLAAGLALWTKQTIGLAATLAVPAATGLAALRAADDRRRWPRALGLFAAGWAAPAILLGGWLARHGALDEFFREVFLDAGASKGSPWRLLLRPWVDPFRVPVLALPAAIGAALGLACTLRLRAPEPNRERSASRAALLAAAFSAGALVAGHALAAAGWVDRRLFGGVQHVAVFFGFFGLLPPTVRLVRTARRAARRGVRRRRLRDGARALLSGRRGDGAAELRPRRGARVRGRRRRALRRSADGGSRGGDRGRRRGGRRRPEARPAVRVPALARAAGERAARDLVAARAGGPAALEGDRRDGGRRRPDAAPGDRAGRADLRLPGHAALLLARRPAAGDVRRSALDGRDAGPGPARRRPPAGERPARGRRAARAPGRQVEGQREVLPARRQPRARALPAAARRAAGARLPARLPAEGRAFAAARDLGAARPGRRPRARRGGPRFRYRRRA